MTAQSLLVTINCFSLQEMQPICDGAIIGITFVHVCVASSKMGSDETETSIMVLKPDAYGALVARHSSEASL